MHTVFTLFSFLVQLSFGLLLFIFNLITRLFNPIKYSNTTSSLEQQDQGTWEQLLIDF